MTGSWEREALREALFTTGVLLDTGLDGVVGRGAVLVRLLDALAGIVTRAAAEESPVVMSFPPVLPRTLLERGGYLGSFPHLTGTVWSFDGTEVQAREQGELAAAGGDWSGYQAMTDLALVPAACHPVYPVLGRRGEVPAEGLTVDAGPASVFRREPSRDPARLQSFTQRELVRVGAPQDVLAWRDRWRDRAAALLTGLGLDVHVDQAADPFFGRAGRVLAASQRAQVLKFELLVPITEPVRTAVASFNAHREHFSEIYGLHLPGGDLAHTACIGFGLERIALALLASHGLDPDDWPEPVRTALVP